MQQMDYLEKGIEKFKARDYTHALALLSAKELDPNNAQVLKWRGTTRRTLGDLKGALEDLNRANELEPNDIFTLRVRGEVNEQCGNLKEALEDLNRADQLKPSDAFILKHRGETKRLLGDLQGALEDLNRADQLMPNDTFTLKVRGDTKRVLGDLQGALEDLNRADQLKPSDAFIIAHRGLTKKDQGDFKGALEDLNKAYELKPNYAFTLKHRGDTKRLLCNLNGVLEDLNKADKLCPNDAFTLKVRGEAKRLLGDLQGALEDLNSAIKLEPNDVFILKVRGETKRQCGDLKGALKDLNRADQLKPSDVFILQHRGETKQLLGEDKEAMEDLSKAAQLNQQALLNLGETRFQLGDINGALSVILSCDLWSNTALSQTSIEQLIQHIEDFKQELKPFDVENHSPPDTWQTLAAKGAVKFLLKDYNGALQYLNSADSLKKNAFTVSLRALTYFSLKLVNNAYVDFCYYEGLNPTTVYYATEKKEVEDMIWAGISHHDITMIKILGEGSFGTVHLANFDGRQVVVKNSKLPKRGNIKKEILTLMKFHHHNIVSSLGFSYNDDNEVSLVMEYAEDGSLHDLLHTKKVQLLHNQILKLACNIASGLSCLHSCRVMHRDLKSANVLLFNGCQLAKIADFGQARFLNEKSLANTITGTIGFIAPEILAEEPYNQSADVYSFGVLLYEMCTNTTIPIIEEAKRMQKIADNVEDEQLRELIMDCCKTEPTQRPTIQECVDRLNQMSK